MLRAVTQLMLEAVAGAAQDLGWLMLCMGWLVLLCCAVSTCHVVLAAGGECWTNDSLTEYALEYRACLPLALTKRNMLGTLVEA